MSRIVREVPRVGKVALIETNGSDRLIACAARVCFGKSCLQETQAENNIEKDKNLLATLIKKKHGTPFEFGGATFEIDCPIFVARQLERYRTASILERSLRYCRPETKTTASYHVPTCLEELVEQNEFEAFVDYETATKEWNCKREDARAVLPLSTKTKFLFKMNLRNLFHVFDERISKEAQKETRAVVERMFESVADAFPLSVAAYVESRENDATLKEIVRRVENENVNENVNENDNENDNEKQGE